MKLKYLKSKGSRINKKVFRCIHSLNGYYYVDQLNIWLPYNHPLLNYYSYSNYVNCKSIRAFRKKLKNYPKDVEFMLRSNYLGYDVYGIGTNSTVPNIVYELMFLHKIEL